MSNSDSAVGDGSIVGQARHQRQPVVIWITGYSGAGKTTVGRLVKSRLRKLGVSAVHLDGDDLRNIFSAKWGYARRDRLELAHSYFRLCNTLLTQGVTVVISAVAMYEEMFRWVKTNVDRSVVAFLSVPIDERLRRDQKTKRVYHDLGNLSELYDEPQMADVEIANFGGTSPSAASDMVISAYELAASGRGSDKGATSHWNKYYSGSALIYEPSTFAFAVAGHLRASTRILEIGCGNGRDSAYLASLGLSVTAIDPSQEAIRLCRERHQSDSLQFIESGLPDITPPFVDAFDGIYSRFCLHAMTESEEVKTLGAAFRALKPGGKMFIECRTINDPLARKGEVISATERICGHYRRFIIMEELLGRLCAEGFAVEEANELTNVSALGDDNPVVARIRARKG